MELFLSYSEIFNFIQGGIQSRCITEAERILNARHLFMHGVRVKHSNNLLVLASCLRTSSLASAPHEIEGNFFIVNNDMKIGNFTCSCKGGAAGCCKHCVAVLLYCNRNNIWTLKELSSTDVKCQWTSNQRNSQLGYEAVPLQDFCHVAITKDSSCNVSATKIKFYRAGLLAVCPEAALNSHMLRCNKRKADDIVMSTSKISNESICLDDFLKACFVEKSIQALYSNDIPLINDLGDNLKTFFIKEIKIDITEAISLARNTLGQDDDTWITERKKRITGSNCYELYTYSKNKSPMWEKKFNSLYNSSFEGNYATAYGTTAEGIAKNIYKEKTGRCLLHSGLIVRPDTPWFGFSPDGITIVNEKARLLEIKCPVSGQFASAKDIVKNLSFILTDESGNYKLRQKHRFYGQVQLGMALLGAEECEFILFAKYDESYISFLVPLDLKFMCDMFKRLTDIYFQEMLPFLFKRKSN